MYRVLDFTVPALPADRPRYLMGVGRPQDLLAAIAPGHRPVRLRVADAQRPQRAGLHRRRADPAPQPPVSARPAAAGGRLSLPGLPAQPRLFAAFVHGGRNAGSGAGQSPQPDLLPAVAALGPAAIAAGRFALFHQQKLAGWE